MHADWKFLQFLNPEDKHFPNKQKQILLIKLFYYILKAPPTQLVNYLPTGKWFESRSFIPQVKGVPGSDRCFNILSTSDLQSQVT